MKENPWKIYHNPRCSKSRCALELLHDKGVTPEVVEYLKTPLDKKALKALLEKLGLRPKDIVRTKESEFAEFSGDLEDDGVVIELLVRIPKLLERPIVVCGERAVVGRPPERVLELLKGQS